MLSPFVHQVPSISSPFLNRRRGAGGSVVAFSPASLYSSGAQGIWLDPSDLTTMFSDRVGTTPVTTPGTVVGLRLDKSKGLTLGAEVSGGLATGALSLAAFAVGTGETLSPGVKTLRFSVVVSSFTSGTLTIGVGAQSVTANRAITISGAGTFTVIYTIPASETVVQYRAGTGGFVGTIDNISVRELAGNHAVAPTDAARPVYGVEPKGGRRNLLTWSEGFDNAVWAAAAVSIANPTKIAADEISFPAVVGADDLSIVRQSVTTLAVPYVASVELKAKAAGDVGKKVVIYINDGSTTGAYFHTLTSDYVRVSTTKTTAATTSYLSIGVFGTNRGGQIQGACNVNIRNAQLEVSSTATNYQKVTTEYDVTEAGVQTCHYCRYDGNNSSMSTAAINFTATDKISVFAGVRKLSDASAAAFIELSSTVNTTSGSFGIFAPSNLSVGFAGKYIGSLNGSTQSITEITGFPAPVSNVLSALYDISGTSIETESIYRVNGSVPAQTNNGVTAGTGNFGNLPLFFGRRNNATIPFNGRDYGIIVVGKTASPTEITTTETWLADKTGFSAPVITGVPTIGVS